MLIDFATASRTYAGGIHPLSTSWHHKLPPPSTRTPYGIGIDSSLEYSTPEEDLYFRYNIDPDWGASRATPTVRRPLQESTPISHQQPREPTPRRALETRRLPGGIITRHTKVVTIRQSADGPTRFFSPRTGYEANDTDEMRLAVQAESEEDDTKTDEADEFDPEADDIPSAAAAIAPPRDITDNVSTKQNEEYRVHENTKRGDRSRGVEDLSVEVDRTLNESSASDISQGRLRWQWDEQYYAGERPQRVTR